ncbi:MAG: CBS domain-containing protein [Deltaproteobacteria bacterium]|nr:MAG: CBS domain-containing protein [Deltaproteobacteria bacterium]
MRDVMSTPPRCIESDTSLSEAAKLFLHFGFRCLIVVDDERRKVVQGIVTTMDLLRALI